jgi:hypothetical protein
MADRNLAAPSATNYQLEGNDYGSTFGAENVTTRVGNYLQIFVKTGIVSATDDVVKKAGRSSELNRQKVLKGIELATDIEMMLFVNGVSGQESGATPRKCAGLPAWITTNTSFGAGGSAGGYSGGTVAAATAGTNRTFTEALVKSTRTTAFGNGATPSQVYMSAPTSSSSLPSPALPPSVLMRARASRPPSSVRLTCTRMTMAACR